MLTVLTARQPYTSGRRRQYAAPDYPAARPADIFPHYLGRTAPNQFQLHSSHQSAVVPDFVGWQAVQCVQNAGPELNKLQGCE